MSKQLCPDLTAVPILILVLVLYITTELRNEFRIFPLS